MIGCGGFSAKEIYSLLSKSVVKELMFVDSGCEGLIGELRLLLETIPVAAPPRLIKCGIADILDSDVVVVASGSKHFTDESPIEWLERNAAIVREVAREFKRKEFPGVIIIATTPVDVMTQVFFEESGLPAKKIIGSGKLLNRDILMELSLESSFGRGREEFAGIDLSYEDENSATWCAARICDVPMVENCQPECSQFGKMLIAKRERPVQIAQRHRNSLFAVGSCIPRICETILRDERTILPVAAKTGGEYGMSGAFLNLPCVVRREGIEKIIELEISKSEQNELTATGNALNALYGRLKAKRIPFTNQV